MRPKARLRMLALAAILSLLSGCTSDGQFTILGYTTRPPFDPSIRTVYVPIFQNTTYLRGIEFEATKALVRELESKSPYKVVSCREEADTELVGRISMRSKGANLLNQLGEVRDVQLGLSAEVRWTDLRSNKPLSVPNGYRLPDRDAPQGDPKGGWVTITPTAQYVPELGGTNASAHDVLVRQLARQIVHMMEVWNVNCGQ